MIESDDGSIYDSAGKPVHAFTLRCLNCGFIEYSIGTNKDIHIMPFEMGQAHCKRFNDHNLMLTLPTSYSIRLDVKHTMKAETPHVDSALKDNDLMSRAMHEWNKK